MPTQEAKTSGRGFFHHLIVVLGAVGLTLLFFLVLPLMQVISQRETNPRELTEIEVTIDEELPEIPEEEEPEEEEEEQPEDLDLEEPEMTLDLNQLALDLGTGVGDGSLQGSFGIDVKKMMAGQGGGEQLFNLGDLDQKPRVIYQPSPKLTPLLRRNAPGRVVIIFIVDRSGRVRNPIAKQSTNPVFEQPALLAVKQWKFEPGKRNGKAVSTRMRVPIKFPEG